MQSVALLDPFARCFLELSHLFCRFHHLNCWLVDGAQTLRESGEKQLYSLLCICLLQVNFLLN